LYYQFFRALIFLRSKSHDINQLLQKSYNIHMLARAAAVKPALAKDPATREFCDQLENQINQGLPIDPDKESREMLSFFSLVSVDPELFGFNPDYRAGIQVDFFSSNLNLNDPWLTSV